MTNVPEAMGSIPVEISEVFTGSDACDKLSSVTVLNWFLPRSHGKSSLFMVVQLSVLLRKTVCDDID